MAGGLHETTEDRTAEEARLNLAMTSIDPILQTSLKRDQQRRLRRKLLYGAIATAIFIALFSLLLSNHGATLSEDSQLNNNFQEVATPANSANLGVDHVKTKTAEPDVKELNNQLPAIIDCTPSCQGHWIGGKSAEVNFPLIAKIKLDPEIVLHWALSFGETVVDQGQQKQADAKTAASFSKITFDVPAVRVETEMKFSYRLTTSGAADTHKELQTGERSVRVYPDRILAPLRPLLKEKNVIVWGQADGLSKSLKQFVVAHKTISSESQLAFRKPDILIVGPDQIGKSPHDQTRLVALAKSGSNVCLLRQSAPKTLAGLPLVQRKIEAPEATQSSGPPLRTGLQWQNHRLAQHRNLFSSQHVATPLLALRIAPEESVHKIAYWPSEESGELRSPVAADALLAVRSLGKGRIVICQIPLGDWENDPRSQHFLVDLCDYLVSPVEETLPLIQRQSQPQPLTPNNPMTPNILDAFQER